jgi:hypothetical protein
LATCTVERRLAWALDRLSAPLLAGTFKIVMHQVLSFAEPSVGSVKILLGTEFQSLRSYLWRCVYGSF